jgi:hypothetical protein
MYPSRGAKNQVSLDTGTFSRSRRDIILPYHDPISS